MSLKNKQGWTLGLPAWRAYWSRHD